MNRFTMKIKDHSGQADAAGIRGIHFRVALLYIV